ncbi:THAP domain-containing protein 3-like isoform X2 [Cyprinodon tularosa]|uniref:THAP domain-containing protein 3-like isoform X2 n=1 Tax=Cyprinodon tularosa TaxID=77115 RepID=UPI0018E28855|nr:THAP domain-containing protein 3-like isoform X2 [Cyprinodon tularosa]
MTDLAAVRRRVVLVVSGLAEALLREIRTVEEKVSFTGMKPRTEEFAGFIYRKMPDFCAAYGCSNRRSVKTRASGITFHTFPKNGKMRKLWELALRRDSFVATDRTLLCSEHFRSEDFDRTGQTVRLKDGVVPKIFNFPAHLQRLVATRNTTTSRRVEDNLPMDVSQDVPQPDAEEVGAAVDQLCLEAVDKILEIMEVNVATQEVTAGEAPPPPDDGCGSSTRTETEQGEKAAIAEAGRDHAYILLLISPAGDAGNLLVALQTTDSAEGELEKKNGSLRSCCYNLA